MHKTGRGSTALVGFGEGGADGADHLIGVAVEVVGGANTTSQSRACNRLIMRRSCATAAAARAIDRRRRVSEVCSSSEVQTQPARAGDPDAVPVAPVGAAQRGALEVMPRIGPNR